MVEEIRERFKAVRGYWPDDFEYVLKNDPDFFKYFEALANHPWSRGSLDPKTRELILLAINSSVTLMDEEAVRINIRNALNMGATKEEVIETLELVSVLGIHAITTGLPILVEEYSKLKSDDSKSRALTQRQIEIMERFKAERGYWSDRLWGKLLELDPEYLNKYIDYSGHPWRRGRLDPKVKELIYIAIDASTTHLYEPGLRQHIQNALKYGATLEEILEVLEIAAEIGFKTCALGFKILEEELSHI